MNVCITTLSLSRAMDAAFREREPGGLEGANGSGAPPLETAYDASNDQETRGSRSPSQAASRGVPASAQEISHSPASPQGSQGAAAEPNPGQEVSPNTLADAPLESGDMLAIVEQLRRTLGMDPAPEEVTQSSDAAPEEAVSPAAQAQQSHGAAEGTAAGAAVPAAAVGVTNPSAAAQGFEPHTWASNAAFSPPEAGKCIPDGRALPGSQPQSGIAKTPRSALRRLKTAAGSMKPLSLPLGNSEVGNHANGSPSQEQRPPKKRSLLSRTAPTAHGRDGGPPDGLKPAANGESAPADTDAAAMAAAVAASAAASWRFEARMQSLEARLQSLARSTSQEKVREQPYDNEPSAVF